MAAKKPVKKSKPKTTPNKLARRAPTTPNALTLPSGRSISFTTDGSQEQLEVRSARGQMELKITLTKDGPVLSLSGVRLEINSSDAVSVNCRAFEVNASEGVHLQTTGEIRAQSRGKMHLDAEVINLNGGDRTGYPDEESAQAAQALVDRVLAERAALAPPPEPHDHQH